MGKYSMEEEKKFYESFYGKIVKVITKTGEVDGRIEKVRTDLEDWKCYIYVRDNDKNLLKIDHDDIASVKVTY